MIYRNIMFVYIFVIWHCFHECLISSIFVLVYYDKDWNTRVIRECAVSGEASDDCKERTGTYKVKVKYCQCGEPGCNSAVNTQISLMTLVVPLFVAVFTAFKKLWWMDVQKFSKPRVLHWLLILCNNTPSES